MTSSTDSKLDALIGLDGAKRLVRKLASGEEGVHAILLYGARGSGKSVLAQALAEAWICRASSDDGACGICQACKALAKGSNPDLLLVEPTGKSSIISVKHIVNENPGPEDPSPTVQRFFRVPPLYSRHKVVQILDAHRMNHSACNSLLKTLEEPHPHAKLVLTTDTIGLLPQTIVSRCLAVACELPKSDQLHKLFPTATEEDFMVVQNAPGRIKALIEKPAGYHRIVEFANGLRARQRIEALACTEDFRAICETFEVKDVVGSRAANTEALDLLATALARNPNVDPRWPQMVIEAHRRVLGNGNPQSVLDAMFTAMLA